MNTRMTLIFLLVLTKSLHAQTKLESELIIAIALKNILPNDTSAHQVNLNSLDSIERLSSSRRFRKIKKLEGLRNYITVLTQVKWANLSCLGSSYSPLLFNSIQPSDTVILDTLERSSPSNPDRGKSKAALARADFEYKNSIFQRNQITMLINQQKIMNDTRIKSDTLLRQLIKDQRRALEKEHRQRWEEEQVQCNKKFNESMNRLQTEVMRLKGIFARAYRRHLNKQKANETI